MANETISIVSTLTVPSDAGYVVISNIPQTGNDLFVIAQLSGDTAQNGDGRVAVYPNGSGSNMDMIWRGGIFGTNNATYGTANYYIRLSAGSAGYAPSNSQLTIFNYSSSSLQKGISWQTAQSEQFHYLGGAQWRDTAPITSLGFQVRDYGTVIKAGSVISIYTIKRAA